MKKLNKNILFLFIISGCAKQPHKKIKPKSGEIYTLKISGVECAKCAKKTVVAIEKQPSVLYAEYVCNDSDYIDCFARLYARNKKNIPSFNRLRKEMERMDFKLNSMQGYFLGRADKDMSKININGDVYKFANNIRLSKKYRNKKKIYYGKITNKDGKNWFEVM